MDIKFKNYNKDDYFKVCEFLVKIFKDNKQYINWSWARWGWMIHHPEFDNNISDKIGIWVDENELVALATYDHSLGESIFITDAKYKFLEESMLKYCIENYMDGNGLGIAINDVNKESIELLKRYGFVMNKDEENVLEINLETVDLEYVIPENIMISNVKNLDDVFNYNKVLWHGFNHVGDIPEDEETIAKFRKMLSAPQNNFHLNVVAKDGDKWVAFCGCWYDKNTDYAYVEPVCTVPEYRGKEIGKAVVLENLKRCKELGAKKAYVISSNEFYINLGFEQHSHYTFYWYKK